MGLVAPGSSRTSTSPTTSWPPTAASVPATPAPHATSRPETGRSGGPAVCRLPGMPANPTPSAVLATVQGYAAWALVRMGDDDTVLAVGGSRSEVASLLDVPLEHGSPDEG